MRAGALPQYDEPCGSPLPKKKAQADDFRRHAARARRKRPRCHRRGLFFSLILMQALRDAQSILHLFSIVEDAAAP